MAVRTIVVRFRVGHANEAQTPTPEECLAAVGKTQWDAELNGNPPNNGAYLLGYDSDLGRRGDERDARGAAHAEDAGFKGRRRGVR
jgi:hypothetical protein